MWFFMILVCVVFVWELVPKFIVQISGLKWRRSYKKNSRSGSVQPWPSWHLVDEGLLDCPGDFWSPIPLAPDGRQGLLHFPRPARLSFTAWTWIPPSLPPPSPARSRRSLFHANTSPKWWTKHLFHVFTTFGWEISFLIFWCTLKGLKDIRFTIAFIFQAWQNWRIMSQMQALQSPWPRCSWHSRSPPRLTQCEDRS